MKKGNWAVVKFIDEKQRHFCLASVELDFEGLPLLAFEDWPEEDITRLTSEDLEFMPEEEFMLRANEWLNERYPSTAIQ